MCHNKEWNIELIIELIIIFLQILFLNLMAQCKKDHYE